MFKVYVVLLQQRGYTREQITELRYSLCDSGVEILDVLDSSIFILYKHCFLEVGIFIMWVSCVLTGQKKVSDPLKLNVHVTPAYGALY